jgi:tetratricopeptide (TPR) repeat protein
MILAGLFARAFASEFVLPQEPVSGQAAPAPAVADHAAPVVAAPAPSPVEQGETNTVESSLRRSANLVQSSNLLSSIYRDQDHEKFAGFQTQLEAARELRRQKMHAQAEAKLVALVQGLDTPDSLRRAGMIELALTAQDNQELPRAQQIYTQFINTYPDDPGIPELLLRQGLLYREMGAYANAINKFFAVLNSSLKVRGENLEYYQKLVLQAQAEIADTYYAQGKYQDASYNYTRLLKTESVVLNRAGVRFKLAQCYVQLERQTEAITVAQDYLRLHAGQPDEPEIRYLLATSFKKVGRKREAMEQVMALLENQQRVKSAQPERWVYWQQRTGNDIANQLYHEGDFQNALMIYTQLAETGADPSWQLPALYQVGLVYERLNQPNRAAEVYDRIAARTAEVSTNQLPPGLTLVIDMSRWRKSFLSWQTTTELASRELQGTATNSVAASK